jgi:ribosome biogenesis GTPase
LSSAAQSSFDLSFHHISSIDDLGWFLAVEGGPLGSGQRPARVVAQSRSSWHVHDGTTVLHARARSRSLDPRPVTGDWVVISGTDDCLVESVLPRRTQLTRAEAGGRSAEQVIAANVDVVAVCAPATQANPRRIERELTAIWSSGATPLVLLTKAEIADDLDAVVGEIAAVCLGVDVIPVSSTTGVGVEHVRAQTGHGRTLALIGPSGVGKSTLVNVLSHAEVLATSAVRSDGKGRHTTTSRHLVALPGGGLVLDTPGMREFAPWADGDGLASAFADVDELAQRCRFSDCAHATEPGCAVRAAADADEVFAARVDSWRRLQREQAWLARRNDARLESAERKRWAAMVRSARGSARP